MKLYGIRVFSEDTHELYYDLGEHLLFYHDDANIVMDMIEEKFHCVCDCYIDNNKNKPEYVKFDLSEYRQKPHGFFEVMNDLYDMLKTKGLLRAES